MSAHLPKIPIVYSSRLKIGQYRCSIIRPRLPKLSINYWQFFQQKPNISKTKVSTLPGWEISLLDPMQQAPDRKQARLNLQLESDAKIVTLLPASRQQEIKYLLPVMCQAARQISQRLPVEFLIPVSLPHYRRAIIDAVEEYNLPAKIVEGQTLDAIAAADLAITKSGTVNLEIALLDVPQIVVYRIHPLTAWIGRRLGFSVPLMSPANLVVNRMLVPELQQEEVTADNITDRALKLLSDLPAEEIIAGYREMRSHLGTIGVSNRVVNEINLAN